MHRLVAPRRVSRSYHAWCGLLSVKIQAQYPATSRVEYYGCMEFGSRRSHMCARLEDYFDWQCFDVDAWYVARLECGSMRVTPDWVRILRLSKGEQIFHCQED